MSKDPRSCLRSSFGVGRHFADKGWGLRVLIEQLNAMTKDIVQTAGVLAAGSKKELWPERGPVLPARPQVPVMVSGQMPQMFQSERRHDTAHSGGHSQQDPRKLRAAARGVPSEHERLVHELYGKFEGKQTRGARGTRLPAFLSDGPLPPLGTPEVNVGEEKGTATGSSPSWLVEGQPRASVRAYEVGGRLFPIPSRTARQQLEKPLVELVHQLQTGRALPLRGRW